MTLASVRDVVRRRTVRAVAQLDAGVFGEGETSWRATVRGHLRAALEAITTAEQDEALAQQIQQVLDSAERASADKCAERPFARSA